MTVAPMPGAGLFVCGDVAATLPSPTSACLFVCVAGVGTVTGVARFSPRARGKAAVTVAPLPGAGQFVCGVLVATILSPTSACLFICVSWVGTVTGMARSSRRVSGKAALTVAPLPGGRLSV